MSASTGRNSGRMGWWAPVAFAVLVGILALAFSSALSATAGSSAAVRASGDASDAPPPRDGDGASAPSVADTLARVPFGPGERATYQVKLGIMSVGTGSMEVHGIERVRGNDTYHVSMGIQGGRLGLRVDSRYESWFDMSTLASRRFLQDQNEVRFTRFRQFEFYPEEQRYERADNDDAGEIPTNLPLDDLSFVYYARTLPLQVGDTYTLPHYFLERGNPVVIRVVRKDRVEVPAGTFNTIVVHPVIQSRGLFGEAAETEIHFTDDDRRIVVYMRSRGIPLLGSLSLHLSELSYATPLRALRSGQGVDRRGAGAP